MTRVAPVSFGQNNTRNTHSKYVMPLALLTILPTGCDNLPVEDVLPDTNVVYVDSVKEPKIDKDTVSATEALRANALTTPLKPVIKKTYNIKSVNYISDTINPDENSVWNGNFQLFVNEFISGDDTAGIETVFSNLLKKGGKIANDTKISFDNKSKTLTLRTDKKPVYPFGFDTIYKDKYFGICGGNYNSTSCARILFYNSGDYITDDYAAKLNTVSGENIILFKSHKFYPTLEDAYVDMVEASQNYKSKTKFKISQGDRLIMPYLKFTQENQIENPVLTDELGIKNVRQVLNFDFGDKGERYEYENCSIHDSGDNNLWLKFYNKFYLFVVNENNEPTLAMYISNPN